MHSELPEIWAVLLTHPHPLSPPTGSLQLRQHLEAFLSNTRLPPGACSVAAGAGWSKGGAGWDSGTMTLQPLINKGQDSMDNHPAFSPLGGAVLRYVPHMVSEDLQQTGAHYSREAPLSNTRFIVFPPFIDCLPNKGSVPKSLSQRLLLRERRLNRVYKPLKLRAKGGIPVCFSGKGYRAFINPQKFLPQTLRKSFMDGKLLLSGLI